MSSKQYFDEVAGRWDEMRASFFPDAIREVALSTASLPAGGLVADVGAGTGFITEALLDAGLRVIAVDQSPTMLEIMRGKFGGDRVAYRLGSAEHLPLETGEVEGVFACMFLHHVEDPAAAIQEMARVLKPRGPLVIVDLDQHDFRFLVEEQHDRWMGFQRDDVSRWFQGAGLTRVAVRGTGSDCCAESGCGTERAQVNVFVASGVR
jgi:ubiquinone/menaquinone biosynthesis C-methylase UbiE